MKENQSLRSLIQHTPGDAPEGDPLLHKVVKRAQARRRRRAAAVAAAVGITGLLLAAQILLFGPEHDQRQAASVSSRPTVPSVERQGLTLPREVGPFGGQRVTLEAAQAAVSFQLVRPTHPLANDSSVRAVFLRVVPDDSLPSNAEQVAIDYDSGILVLLEPASQVGFEDDPATQYQEMAEGYPPGKAEVSRVHGVPALLIPRDVSNAGPAIVDLTLEGVRVILYGAYAPLELSNLIEVAETVS
jgi:hypothetical protein